MSSMENEYDRELSSLTLQSNNFLFSLQYHIRTLRWCLFIDFERGQFLLNSYSSFVLVLIKFLCLFKDKLERYGRITWKRPNTMRGHYFWDLVVAKLVSIHHTFKYQMKDIFIIFQMIPHSLILTEWFGHSALPK